MGDSSISRLETQWKGPTTLLFSHGPSRLQLEEGGKTQLGIVVGRVFSGTSERRVGEEIQVRQTGVLYRETARHFLDIQVCRLDVVLQSIQDQTPLDVGTETKLGDIRDGIRDIAMDRGFVRLAESKHGAELNLVHRELWIVGNRQRFRLL